MNVHFANLNSLGLIVHFLCLSKENEPKEKTPKFVCPAGSLAAQNALTVGMIRIHAQHASNELPCSFVSRLICLLAKQIKGLKRSASS